MARERVVDGSGSSHLGVSFTAGSSVGQTLSVKEGFFIFAPLFYSLPGGGVVAWFIKRGVVVKLALPVVGLVSEPDNCGGCSKGILRIQVEGLQGV